MSLTIQGWAKHFRSKYATKREYLKDLDKAITELKTDGGSPHQLAFYKRVKNKFIKLENEKPYQRFIKWLGSDNIIKQNNGYLTQCSQYGKLFTRKELYVYFKKNYI